MIVDNDFYNSFSNAISMMRYCGVTHVTIDEHIYDALVLYLTNMYATVTTSTHIKYNNFIELQQFKIFRKLPLYRRDLAQATNINKLEITND